MAQDSSGDARDAAARKRRRPRRAQAARRAADPFARAPARQADEARSSIRPRSSTPAWCWASPWPATATSEGEDHFLVLPGDDVQADLSHRRHAAQGRQRQLHRRRLLREQDERVRRQLRLRADPQAAGAARHDRPHHAASAWSTRSQIKLKPGADGDAVRDQLARRLSPGSFTASTPGATSKAPCWPPCRWKPPSSTCCCS